MARRCAHVCASAHSQLWHCAALIRRRRLFALPLQTRGAPTVNVVPDPVWTLRKGRATVLANKLLHAARLLRDLILPLLRTLVDQVS
jgi:hypothetical protein